MSDKDFKLVIKITLQGVKVNVFKINGKIVLSQKGRCIKNKMKILELKNSERLSSRMEGNLNCTTT